MIMHINVILKRGKSKGLCHSFNFNVRQIFTQYFLDSTNWTPKLGPGDINEERIQPSVKVRSS